MLDSIRRTIRDVPDFPNLGILFKDITPVLADPKLLAQTIDGMIEITGITKVDKVVGIDARGFIFGALIAERLGAGFIPVRKKGKLPWQTRGIDYALEYGTNSVEMHLDAIAPGETVLLADDLLATGGTAAAALHLIEQAGGKVLGSTFFIELAFLNGREKVNDSGPVHSLITY
ncbi:adenine phosphoribosyltransferase [Prosthecobacter sp.]|uniref:adenine phosphoribosyltransferase n=1 Tax=Prosthecobacter sp. TaxID=1965333 RepID=UPI0031F3190B